MGVRQVLAILLIGSLAACAGGGGSGASAIGNGALPPPQSANDLPPAATTLYIQNPNVPGASVQLFSAGGSGVESPVGSISTEKTADTIVTDAQGDIYVSEDPGRIVEFPSGSTGDATPIRSITGSNTRLNLLYVHDFAVGPDGTIAALSQQIVNGCAGPFEIDVFAPGANGNVAPVRTIVGANTGISQGPLAIDAAGNIYLAIRSGKSILVFDPLQNGNVSPSREYNTPIGLQVDLDITPSGQLAVLNANDFSAWTIEEFPIASSGTVNPTSTITGRGGADAFAIDNAGNFYVEYSNGQNELVNVYASGASGAATPLRSITLQGIAASSDVAVH